MLHTFKEMTGYAIHAAGDDVGKVKDYYFDDSKWVIRYLIVETGSWLESRKVLLSPMAVTRINHEDKTFSVSINSEQVKHSPSIDTQKPVSRQYEIEYIDYYGYPAYWEGNALWGVYANPMIPANADAPVILEKKNVSSPTQYDHHLRSCEVVIGNSIAALDGDIGHLEEMLIDEDTWAIRYLIINTSNWGLGHQVLIAPQWIESIRWPEAKIHVDVTRQTIKDAPVFNPAEGLNPQQEKALFSHYQRKGYWE